MIFIKKSVDKIRSCRQRSIVFVLLIIINRLTLCLQGSLKGAQWLSGRVPDSRRNGCRFEPHRRHCVVVLEPSLVLVQPRKTRPYITERLLMGRKESNQTKQGSLFSHLLIFSKSVILLKKSYLRTTILNCVKQFESRSGLTKCWP